MKMEGDVFQPLVSVAVVTYNSSKTVLETLDSIAGQTYQNLELIVSDDCSTDNTVEICRKWMEAHKERFVRTELLTVEKNTGVSANMNRADDACQGEWVKEIAGDDVLMQNCIEIYMDFVKEHPGAVVVFANVEFFGGDEDRRRESEDWYSEKEEFFSWSKEEQYDYLTLVGDCIPAPASFYHREKVLELDVRNDERIPFCEDLPKWINFLKKGVHFDYVNKVTVRYRLSDSSLCGGTSEKFLKSKAKVYLYYCFKNEFNKGSKKKAVLQWIRAQRTIHDNAIGWRAVGALYKAVFNVK